MENKQKDMKEAGNCRQNVKELRIRLSALDLELQKSNSSAVEHLSSLENCREQHLQLLRELGITRTICIYHRPLRLER